MTGMKTDKECPFCAIAEEREVICESAGALAIHDHYPVSPGHTLVIPRKHISDYFELAWAEQQELWQLVNRCKAILTERYHPDGFNVGINVGPAAGQTIFHVHIHLIPRYKGDVENPRGGIRHTIPGKGYY
ncbi:MAG: AP-4-A phosphorylase [Bacteroidetes bacterium ADurb.Bin139]|nr:MAG: AP-4-A phosphorylase [Bacteroidetes bacterium ADurb.Bin139]